jgi:hypothetical protein
MYGQSLLKATTRASTGFHLFAPQSKEFLVPGQGTYPLLFPHQPFDLWYPTSRWETLIHVTLTCLRDGLGLILDLVLLARALQRVLVRY